jgi:single-stranded DNA-binding protein
MTIRTKESLSGFIASDPQLTFTSSGDARLYARVGQDHFQREEDGAFTKLEPTFADLVMFGKSAERAHAQFHKGDAFIGEGETRNYTQSQDGQEVEREQFIASRIGHDNNTTRYTVDRPARTSDKDAVTAALAERAEQLDPEPAPAASSPSAVREAVAR